MRRTKLMWLGSLALMGLLVPTMVRADVDPEAALAAINAHRAATIKDAQDKKLPLNGAAIMKEYADAAKEDVKGVDPTMVEPAKGLAWARLFSAANQPKDMVAAAQRFLTSTPAPEPKLQAQILILNGSAQAKDADTILKTLADMKPSTPASAAQIATLTAGAGVINTVADKKGTRAALDLLKQVEAQLPLDQFKTKQELASADAAIYTITDARAELFKKDGKQADEIAALEEGKKHLSADSRYAAALTGKITFISLPGSPAPALKSERGYGNFASLDAYKGKVVVLDFMAHWCPPCKASLPDMKAMYNDLHSKGLEVVSVTTYYGYFGTERGITPDAEFAKMEGFVAQYGMTWPVIFGDHSNMINYGVSGIPQFVIIDQSGKVNSIVLGYSKDLHAELRKTVEDLLNKKIALK